MNKNRATTKIHTLPGLTIGHLDQKVIALPVFEKGKRIIWIETQNEQNSKELLTDCGEHVEVQKSE